MHHRNAWLLTFVLLAAACKPTAPAAEAAVAASPAAPAAAASASDASAVQPAAAASFAFTEDMPYADLRRQLTDAGWLPLRDPMCRENVGGEAPVCNDLPEVESCSGDGHCVMHFANAQRAQRIRVTTYGPYDRWNVKGEEAAFAVKSWQLTELAPAAKTAATSAVACPSRDFDVFLKAFASDDNIERAFTAPVVKVAELYTDDNGDHARMVYVDGRAYDDFNVRYGGQAFHYVDSEGRSDMKALRLEIEGNADEVKTVRYMYGVSEGNSYTFNDSGDCWYLVEDPEAPSP